MRSIGSPEQIQSLVSNRIINPLTVAALLLTAAIRVVYWAAGNSFAECPSGAR